MRKLVNLLFFYGIFAVFAISLPQKSNAQSNGKSSQYFRICIVPGVPINCVPLPPTTTAPIGLPMKYRIKCRPSMDEVALYSNKGLSGTCVKKQSGNYVNSAQIGLDDNSISSIIVGKNMHVIACAEPHFKSNCDFFQGGFSTNKLAKIVPFRTGSRKALSTNPKKLQKYREKEKKYYEDERKKLDQLGEGYAITKVGEDNISSLYIRKKQCAKINAGVTVYNQSEYYGLCRDFSIGDEFHHKNLPLFGKKNESHIPKIKMNSFIVLSGRSGVQVCFCKKRFGAGDCKLAFYSRESKDVVRIVDKINLEEYEYVTVQAYGDSCPLRTTPVTPRPKTGYKTVRIYNCNLEKIPLDVWIRSKKEGQTVKSKYNLVANIPHLWSRGSCPTGNHWTYSLSDGIIYDFAFVDGESSFCLGQAHPNRIGCAKFKQDNIRGGASAKFKNINVR